MTIYVHTFTVRGRGTFPLDMLRRDKCYPRQETDSNAMRREQGADTRDVQVQHVTTGAHWHPCFGRWASFGWEVVSWVYEDPRGRSHVVDVARTRREVEV